MLITHIEFYNLSTFNIAMACISLYLNYNNICQWLATGRWFSPGNPVSPTNKTDRRDITEMLLKVALNTINQPTTTCYYFLC